MRRLVAHIAMLAVYAGFFSPLLAAEQSSLHACCLRAGAHHCRETSEAGFNSKANVCPYSTPLPSGAVFSLESATFSISSPAITGELAQHCSSCYIGLRADDLSARAPPNSLP